MKLKYPGTNIDFDVTPEIFSGAFDIYDREEDLGEELNKFNPNDPSDLEALFDKYFFNIRHESIAFELEHKIHIEKMLKDALLKCEDMGFYLHSEDDDYFYLPSEWLVENPTMFFAQAYRGIIKNWGAELEHSGKTLLGESTLKSLSGSS